MQDGELRARPRNAGALAVRGGSLTFRAVVVWFGIMFLAIGNGGLREAVLVPRIGSSAAHVVSTLLLSALILTTAWFTIRWIGPWFIRDALVIGALWMTLTFAFEFLAGHYLFGVPWRTIIADYDIMSGRIWPLVPLTTLVAPVWAWIRHLTGERA